MVALYGCNPLCNELARSLDSTEGYACDDAPIRTDREKEKPRAMTEEEFKAKFKVFWENLNRKGR